MICFRKYQISSERKKKKKMYKTVHAQLHGTISSCFSEKRNGMPVLPEHMTIFQKKHKKGIIDVWWLYDDGGKNPRNINIHCPMTKD